MSHLHMHRNYRGVEFQPNNVIKKNFLTGAKFHVNSLDASGFKKNFRGVGCTPIAGSKGLQRHYSNFFQVI